MSDDQNSPGVPRKNTFKVYLVDYRKLTHKDWTEAETPGKICALLKDWWTQIANKAGWNGSPPADVLWVKTLPAAIQDYEIAVYLRERATSKLPADALAKTNTDTRGMTLWRGASGMHVEIWAERIPEATLDTAPTIAANIIFHEMMHWKLDAHPDNSSWDIHKTTRGLGHSPVGPEDSFTDTDRDEMAEAIARQYKAYRTIN